VAARVFLCVVQAEMCHLNLRSAQDMHDPPKWAAVVMGHILLAKCGSELLISCNSTIATGAKRHIRGWGNEFKQFLGKICGPFTAHTPHASI
jgi:hypothetical protein